MAIRPNWLKSKELKRRRIHHRIQAKMATVRQQENLPYKKNWQTRSRKSQSGREIENAWGVSKAKTKLIEDVTEKPKGQMLRDMDDMDFKSEYGRDGVDISSTFVGNDATDKLVHASLVKRTSPDGTQFTKYSEVTKNPRTLHKVNTTPIRQ